MEPKQTGYLNPEGNYIPINVDEQKAIETQIEENRRMEEENPTANPDSIAKPSSENKMDEDDIIEINKEIKENKKEINNEIDEIIKKMEEDEKIQEEKEKVQKEIQEKIQKEIDESNKMVPWLHPRVNNFISKVVKVNGKVPEENKQYYKQPAKGRAIDIRFNRQISNRSFPVEIKRFEKIEHGTEVKKENETKSITKKGEFKDDETVQSKDVSRTEIKILLEYSTPKEKYPVYYLMTIKRWGIKIDKIKEIVDPWIDEDLSDQMFLTDEYRNEPKEFNKFLYKKARVFIPNPYPYPYVQTKEEMERNHRPRPPVRTEYYYKIPEEIQEVFLFLFYLHLYFEQFHHL